MIDPTVRPRNPQGSFLELGNSKLASIEFEGISEVAPVFQELSERRDYKQLSVCLLLALADLSQVITE